MQIPLFLWVCCVETCGVCTFSPCLRGSAPGPPASSHSHRPQAGYALSVSSDLWSTGQPVHGVPCSLAPCQLGLTPPATPQGLRVGGNPNGWNAKRTHYVGRVTCLYLTFLLTDNLYPFHMRQTQTPQLDFGKVRTTQFSIRHREHLSAANLQANLSSCAPRLKCFPQEWVSAVDHFNVICVVHTHVICNMVT